MLTEIKGVVIRETNVGEADKILSIFTDSGIVSATAKGVRSIKSKFLPCCQLFCYASYVLYSKNGYYWIKEASLIDNFFDIRLSLEKTAAAGYICEVIDYTATSEPCEEYLSLALNSLYALSKDKYPVEKIKAAFEIKTASLLGFMPDIDACHVCQSSCESYTLDIMNGNLVCDECKSARLLEYSDPETDDGYRLPIVNITEGARAAMHFIIHTPVRDILRFNLSDQDMLSFARGSQAYFLNHIDHEFKTLNFYYEVSNL